MWKIHRIAEVLLGTAFSVAPVYAQTTALDPQRTIIVPSQSSVYNQNAVNLPTAPQPNGQDVVRSSGGTSCQSAVSTNNPYLDIGVIGSDDVFDRETQALYGRIVVPLGPKPRRVDCTRLYELEIARLSMELEMMKLSIPSPAKLVSAEPTLSQTAEPVKAIPATSPSPDQGVVQILEQPAPAPEVVLAEVKVPVQKTVPVNVSPARYVPVSEKPPRDRDAVTGPLAAADKKKNCRFFAQLGSFLSETDARQAWTDASERKSALLSGHQHRITEYQNGAKTYFRLRAGPLSQEDARVICQRIDADCLVVMQKM